MLSSSIMTQNTRSFRDESPASIESSAQKSKLNEISKISEIHSWSSNSSQSSSFFDASNNTTTCCMISPFELAQIPLIPMDCHAGVLAERHLNLIPLAKVTHKERKLSKADVTVFFCIRRPGCGNCREHARQLSELVQQDPNVALAGVVAKSVDDNSALLDFQQHYFPFHMYRDSSRSVFRLLGGKAIGLRQVLSSARKVHQRCKHKEIKYSRPILSPLQPQGGVLVFDAHDRLQYMQREEYGKELDMDQLRSAIEAVREKSASEETMQ